MKSVRARVKAKTEDDDDAKSCIELASRRSHNITATACIVGNHLLCIILIFHFILLLAINMFQMRKDESTCRLERHAIFSLMPIKVELQRALISISLDG